MTNQVISADPTRSKGPLIVFGIVILVAVGIFVLLALAVKQHSAGPLATGNAPEFTVNTFDGQRYKLSELRGKPIVINFWASWCIPCRDEAPGLQRTWETYQNRGLIVLGVDYVDTEADAKKFIAEFKETYPNGADLGTLVSQAYHISGVPETYFIDKEGRLLQGIDDQGRQKGNFIGPVPQDVLTARVEELLQQ